MSMRAYLFDADGKDQEVELNEQITASLSDRQLLWVDLAEYTEAELKQVQSLLHLHQQSVRNLLNPIGRPRLDNYGEYFQVNIVAVKGVEGRFITVILDLFSGPNYVVTVHPEPVDFLQHFDQQVRGDTQIGQLNAASFLAALLDWHVTSYFRVIDQVEGEVDQLDEEALRKTGDRKFLVKLTELRRRVAELRRLITPHREVFSALSRPDFAVISGSESAAHFRTLNDRLERAIEAVESARDMVIGSFELFMTGTAQNTNDIVKVLTLVTVMIGLVGVIAGIMGMNFELGFFKSGAVGFGIVIAGMLLLIGSILATARSRGWF